jgi:hypothetical protein
MEFKKYIYSPEFLGNGFSPYTLIDRNIFEVSEEDNFVF